MGRRNNLLLLGVGVTWSVGATAAIGAASLTKGSAWTEPLLWIGGILGICGVVFLVLYWRSAQQEDTMPDDKDQPSQVFNITSHNQSGGITAHTVSIHAPQPSVQAIVESSNTPTSTGEFVTRGRVHLDAPYAARALLIDIRGSSILNYELRPIGTTSVNFNVQWSIGPTHTTGSIGAPLSNDYDLTILTEQPDDLVVEVKIQI